MTVSSSFDQAVTADLTVEALIAKLVRQHERTMFREWKRVGGVKGAVHPEREREPLVQIVFLTFIEKLDNLDSSHTLFYFGFSEITFKNKIEIVF